MPVEEIAERFEQCVREPSMRSASAVLRITREQIHARGQLSIYPKLALWFLEGGVALLLASRFLPADTQKSVMPGALGALALSAILGYGAFTGREDRKASLLAEHEIYRLATEALDKIVAEPFPRKPLTREQVDTLKDLVKRSPTSMGIREFLNG
ncbi:hypothetical protein OP10G_4180 [Fimbriimonas ginsengisoli Gsoil 348]|uniref:SMODS and SLOG-associating 2TM effector domain-containing protein n=2 Tax=Fimbriimonas ginsengisoli TaxID=1005039 RepID=A0A068NVN5_FIMGI|nr:hypothetical protein OP10G_4180 [Fimbriimonas ginsengisoli Gsoil 348]